MTIAHNLQFSLKIKAGLLNVALHAGIYSTNLQHKKAYLLHLELDGGFDFIHFVTQLLRVGAHGREFTSLVETRTYQTWDLLDQGIRGDESIILLCCMKERNGLSCKK